LVLGLVALAAVAIHPVPCFGQEDWKAALEKEKTANVARIAEIEKQAPAVFADYQASQKAIEEHNANPCTYDESNPNACDSYNERAVQLNDTSTKLLAKLQAFKDEEDKLIARNQEISRRLNCVQLPIKCTANSDCTCSKCCGTWDGAGGQGMCQPTCK
jgi:hypothetical protein